jgi:hypothetical protein
VTQVLRKMLSGRTSISQRQKQRLLDVSERTTYVVSQELQSDALTMESYKARSMLLRGEDW